MTNGTQGVPTPQPAQPAPQATPASQAPAPKKGKGLKIFLWIFGSCVVILIILGVVSWYLVKKAAEKATNEWNAALQEIEQTSVPQLQDLEQLQKSLETITPTETTTPIE